MKHFNPTTVKIFFGKKMFPEPCGIKTFQSDHQTVWVGAIWYLQHWSKALSDNSPSPALTAIAKGRIFSITTSTVQITKSWSKTRDNQVFVQRLTDSFAQGSSFHNRTKTGSFFRLSKSYSASIYVDRWRDDVSLLHLCLQEGQWGMSGDSERSKTQTQGNKVVQYNPTGKKYWLG